MSKLDNPGARTLRVGQRFCGPATSANGGYFAGLVAGTVAHTVSVRLREGLAERREIKSVTAVATQETAVPAAVSRLLLQDWPIVTVAVLVAGFAAALVALGSLGVSDFIALVAPLTAVLAVVAATRGQRK